MHALRAVGLEPEQVVLEITERSSARLDHVVADATRLLRLDSSSLSTTSFRQRCLEMLRELPLYFLNIYLSVIIGAV